MTTNDNILVAKLCPKYWCENCDYFTCKKSSIDKHYASNKHKINVLTTNNNGLVAKLCSKKYMCKICEKIFNDRSGLWRHNKKCITEKKDSEELVVTETSPTNEIQELKDIMKYLMKENSDMKGMMMEVIKNGTHINNNINTHTNSHNKAFNLNFFLNETCKDAMNIMDFVESIKLQVSDLESVGELGYIEGISNIIVKNLNALDVTQRPVHCTDKKRETIYIKDDNKWEKDEEQKKMHKMIKKVADKNARLLPKFTEKYPDYKNYHSKTSDKYSKIIVESMGGSGDNDYEKEEKIIKNIAKNILVGKGY
jgi:hypothetical protein